MAKRYDILVGASGSPFADLRAALQADGRTVDWRDYGGFSSFRVTG